jgi:FkbM family methyltransferase
MSIEKAVRIAKILKIDVFLRLGGLYKPTNAILEEIIKMAWKRRAKRFYSQFIGKGDVAFDVGANIGTRVEIFKKLGAIVVAVEPQQQCIDILRRRFAHQVSIEQVALGRAEGQAEIMINDGLDVVSSLSKEFIDVSIKINPDHRREDWNRTAMVKVKTMDSLISKYGCPSFCKIDVEGYEHEVLMGLSQPIAALSIEFHPALLELSVKSINRLEDLGFTEYNYSMVESMKLALPKWVNSREIIGIIKTRLHDWDEGDIYARRGKQRTE